MSICSLGAVQGTEIGSVYTLTVFNDTPCLELYLPHIPLDKPRSNEAQHTERMSDNKMQIKSATTYSRNGYKSILACIMQTPCLQKTQHRKGFTPSVS